MPGPGSPEWLAEIRTDAKFVERCSFKEFAAIFLHGYDQAEGALECYHAMITTRLNPNAGELIIKVNKREGAPPTFEPIIPIASLRLLAEETGLRAGETEPQWCGEDGIWQNVWPKTKLSPPHAARVGIYRQGCPQPFWGVAYFEEMAQQVYDGQRKCWMTADHWLLRPASNILRCAESAAIRRAFPQLKFRTPEELEADGNPKPVDLAPLRKSIDKVHQVASRAPAPVATTEKVESYDPLFNADGDNCGYPQTKPTAPHALPTGTGASSLTGWGPARTGQPRELPLQSPPRGADLVVIDDPIKPLQTPAGREFCRLLVQVYEDQFTRDDFLLREFHTSDATLLGIDDVRKGLVMLRRRTGHPNPFAPPAGSPGVAFFEELPQEGGGDAQ